MPPAQQRGTKNPVLETKETNHLVDGFRVTYQRELVQCGKRKCRRWHGPYWYAYWKASKRTRTLYVGKVFRHAAQVRDEQRAKRRAAKRKAAA